MSILIKGMEMPTDYPLWIVVGVDGIVQYNYVNEWKTAGEKAVPVPPHGRLIDSDKLTERLDGIWDCNDMVFEDDNICERIHADCNSCRWRETRDYITDHAIKHAPTIIPADEEET